MQIRALTWTRPEARTKPSAGESLSRPTSSWTVLWATIVKDMRTTKRYMPNLVGRIVDLTIRLAVFLVLASTLTMQSSQTGGQPLSGRSLYIYFIGALVLFVFQGPTLWGPVEAVNNDLLNGTLEFLYSNPCSRYAYYVGTTISRTLISLVVFLPFYLGLVLYSQISLGNMLLILFVCLVTLVTLTAMGIMIALLGILWRQIGSVLGVVERLFEFLSGAYVPLTAFPLFAQVLGFLLPYTWSYDLIRHYSLSTWQTILPVWQEWLVLLLYAVVFTILSRYLLNKVEQLAKKQGLNLI